MTGDPFYKLLGGHEALSSCGESLVILSLFLFSMRSLYRRVVFISLILRKFVLFERLDGL